jgi:tetratricopeptide (TPR) repeat protein
MVRASLLGFVLLVATAATAAAASREPLFDDVELLSGRALAFAASATPVIVPTGEQAFGLDAEMQAFVAPLAAYRDPRQRMIALIKAMEARGMFSLEYAEVTRTASGTFHDRQGNCLSFTMLFVALARAIELRANFQSVEVPPSWAYDGTVVIANHVNAAVRTGGGVETTVDFNIRPYEGSRRVQHVADAYALGLFYTNLGAEALLRGEQAAALVYFREAASAHAGLAGLWSNLGVLYSRNGKYEHAEAAYLRALDIDPEEPSALANLALVYHALGETQLAAEYDARVQSYRERNPYYHFASAVRAYEQQQLDAALASLRRAVRLKPDEHEFYALRGEVQTALGKSREAMRSAERARELEQAEALREQARVELGGLALR